MWSANQWRSGRNIDKNLDFPSPMDSTLPETRYYHNKWQDDYIHWDHVTEKCQPCTHIRYIDATNTGHWLACRRLLMSNWSFLYLGPVTVSWYRIKYWTPTGSNLCTSIKLTLTIKCIGYDLCPMNKVLPSRGSLGL